MERANRSQESCGGVRVCICLMCGCIDGVVKRMMGDNVRELYMSAYEGEKRSDV